MKKTLSITDTLIAIEAAGLRTWTPRNGDPVRIYDPRRGKGYCTLSGGCHNATFDEYPEVENHGASGAHCATLRGIIEAEMAKVAG